MIGAPVTQSTALIRTRIVPGILVAGLLVAVLGHNLLLTSASFGLLALLVGLLWRPGEPPALLFAMAYHWAQASTLIFYADAKGMPLDVLSPGTAVVEASWLTLAGVLVVALGMRLGAGRCAVRPHLPAIASMVAEFDLRRLFIACIVALAVALLTARLAGLVPGLTQPLLAIALVRWAIVLQFAYVVFVRHEGYGLLLALLLVELGIGFLGFFSDFKTVLVILAVAGAGAPQALRGARLSVLAGIALSIIALGVVWSGIKVEYRQFLNQGTGQQVVLVPITERIGKLAELVADLDADRLQSSTEVLAQRVTYVEFFGMALEHVPRVVPHTDGQLWGEAVSRALVPRLIDPNKSVIDDSTRTSLYTGTRVAGASQGTSISLGYIAESYIDFGPLGMFLVLAAWGLLVGVAFRVLSRSGRYPLLSTACACTLVAVQVSVLEQSNLKMVAATLLGFLALYAANRFGARALLLATLRPLQGRDARRG